MTKHNGTGTRLYNIWKGMRKRCYSKTNKDYFNYGGRGITICNEWHDFNNFREWAFDNGYNDALTIDRINVNGNYEPNNCRWVTQKEQQNNKRTNHIITFNNETHTIAEWERIKRFKKGTIKDRLKRGWSIEKALTTPILTNYIPNNHGMTIPIKNYTINGITYSQNELCKAFNIPSSTFRGRIKRGWSIAKALNIE